MKITRRRFIKGAASTMALVVAGPLVATPAEELRGWADPNSNPLEDIEQWAAQLRLRAPRGFTFEDMRHIALSVPGVRQVQITWLGMGEVLVEVDRSEHAVAKLLAAEAPACCLVTVQRMVRWDGDEEWYGLRV